VPESLDDRPQFRRVILAQRPAVKGKFAEALLQIQLQIQGQACISELGES